MHNYKDYKEFYKLVGFFTVVIGTFILVYKVSSWLIWAHQCINAAI
jgi:hypothetical protein